MKITLKLYATLGDLLPTDAVANTIHIEVEEDATPNQIIERYKVPRARAHLVLHNGLYVPPPQRDAVRLKEGDSLAIWPPVAGG